MRTPATCGVRVSTGEADQEGDNSDTDVTAEVVRPQGWGWAQASWSRWQSQTLEVSKEGPALGQKAVRRPSVPRRGELRRPSAPCRGERGREVAPYAVPRAAVPLRLAPLRVLGRAQGPGRCAGPGGEGDGLECPGGGGGVLLAASVCRHHAHGGFHWLRKD